MNYLGGSSREGKPRGPREAVGKVISADILTVKPGSADTGENGMLGNTDTPHFSKHFTRGWIIGARYVTDRLAEGDSVGEIEIAIKAISAASAGRGQKRPKSLKRR